MQINQSPLCWQCGRLSWEDWGEKLQVGHQIREEENSTRAVAVNNETKIVNI